MLGSLRTVPGWAVVFQHLGEAQAVLLGRGDASCSMQQPSFQQLPKHGATHVSAVRLPGTVPPNLGETLPLLPPSTEIFINSVAENPRRSRNTHHHPPPQYRAGSATLEAQRSPGGDNRPAGSLVHVFPVASVPAPVARRAAGPSPLPPPSPLDGSKTLRRGRHRAAGGGCPPPPPGAVPHPRGCRSSSPLWATRFCPSKPLLALTL